MIHVVESAQELMSCSVERHFLKALHEEVGDHRRHWPTHSHDIGLLVELATEAEVGEVRTWRNDLRIYCSKI
jgi:hypothetical protein